MSTNLLNFTKELISHRSITPDDCDVQKIIAEKLKPMGFSKKNMKFKNVSNIWLRKGKKRPILCFLGHTDVVPPGPENQWKFPPFSPKVSKSILYGRGAADMKSSITAFIYAVERFIKEFPKHDGSIAILLTSDEEGDAINGTVKVVELLEKQNQKPDFCIVGEPTSNKKVGDVIKNGRRGSLSGKVIIHGKQGHVAYPHLADNPIHKCMIAFDEMTKLTWDKGHESFPPTSFQISNFSSGHGVSNVIPGEAEINFNFRFSPASTIEKLKKKVHSILLKHKLDFTIQWFLSGKPFITKPGNLTDKVSAAIKKITGYNPVLSTDGGTSDGRFMARICNEIIELGPNNKSIHKVNENIPVTDLKILSNIYFEVLKNVLDDK